MRHLTRLTLIVGAAFAMLLGTSLQAQAAYSYTYVDPFDYTWDDDVETGSCAIVGFQKYGDLFLVEDVCSDGRSVEVEWRYSGGSTQEYWQYQNGYTGFAKAALYNREIAEDRYFQFRVGLSNNGNHVAGTWSAWNEVYNNG